MIDGVTRDGHLMDWADVAYEIMQVETQSVSMYMYKAHIAQ